MNKIELKKGVSLALVNTNQFKDVLINIRFLSKVDRKNTIIRTILSQMLYDRCTKWPTKQAVSEHMDDLYGASVFTRGYNYGDMYAFEFRFKCINEQYTNENTFERIFKTAYEFVFQPLLKDGYIDCDLFEEAKKETILTNARRQDQPQTKAMSMAGSMFAQGYSLAKTQLITKEEIQEITCEDATSAYYEMLRQDEVMMFVVGKINEEKTLSYVQRFFDFEAREEIKESAYLVKKEDLEEDSQVMSIDQSVLVMMFTTDCNIATEDYWTMRVANGLFGQLSTSLLFQEIREKRSLCYSIYSRPMAFEGGLAVSTGIQRSKLEEVKQCVLEQVDNMCNGNFKDEDFQSAKVMLINAINGSFDDPMNVVNFEFQNAILDHHQSLEQCVEAIEKTTKEDVMKVFKKIKHVVTFSLLQEDENGKAY